ncbi:MAG: hypothetical protein U0P30_14240 [Vicinamibacterales bacterium]
MTRVLLWTIVAVAARLGASAASANAGVFADMAQYHERALALLTSGTLPDALRGPGYPALLAAAYALGGPTFWTARVANAVVGGLLTLLTGVVAARAGAGPRAWIASAIVALYPALVLSSVYLMPDALYALLALLALLLVRHRAPAFAAPAGVVAALAILTRSVGLSLVGVSVLVAVWAVVSRQAPARVAWSRVAIFVMACLVVLAPWLRFTTRIAGGPLLDTTSGMNVLLGNHDGATGRLRMADDAPLRERFVNGAKSEADANARAMRAGAAWAMEHPGAALRLALVKTGYLLGLEGREHAWVYGQGYFGPRASWVVTAWGVALLLSFPLLVVVAVVGAARARGPLTATHVALGAFVVLTCLLHVASFGESRFHLPLVPVLAVAASLGHGPVSNAGASRLVAAIVVVALLAVAWTSQAPELVSALLRLRAPDGWTAALPY